MKKDGAVVHSCVKGNGAVADKQDRIDSVPLRVENDGCSEHEYHDSHSIFVHETCSTQITVKDIVKNTTQHNTK